MLSPTPQQLKKLEKLAKVLDGGDVELLTQLDRLEDKVEKDIQDIQSVVTDALAIAEQTKKLEGKPGYTPIKGVDYHDGIDGENYILTDKDKQDIAKSITVPVVEKVIEKTETIIREVPIVTKEIVERVIEKEVATLDDAIVGYLENEIGKLAKVTAKINSEKSDGIGLVVRQLQAGRNISIDTNQEYPTITNTNPKITVSDTEPTSPVLGDIWIDTTI